MIKIEIMIKELEIMIEKKYKVSIKRKKGKIKSLKKNEIINYFL